MSQNNQSAPSTGGGAAGRGLATEPAPTIQIRKYGRNMNSKKFERRWLYLYIEPFDDSDLERGINKAVDALNTLIVAWRPPARSSYFRPAMWWEHIPCVYCRRRAEYELKRWLAGEYVWRRGMCLRHWFIYHLSAIMPDEAGDLISNQPINVVADSKTIMLNIETVNYKYNVKITKELAEAEVNYKGTTYKFTYRNHMGGFPYISSYMNIVFDAYGLLEVLRDFLTEYVLKRRLYSNVVINDSITLPPSPPTADGCAVCQL